MTDTADTTRPTAIVHRTPGLLDLRSLTVMGLSAKPNAGGHPIGQFGTGLKYAVATLLRLGARLTIFIGEDEYVFQPVTGSFRGAEFTGLKFRRRRGGVWGKSTALPFTTQYGRYWKPWMAFRELHSNTLDEGGLTFDIGEENEVAGGGLPDFTTIVVEHDDYVQAWLDRDTIFLPDAQRVATPGDMLQILDGESDHLYYRGLRVLDLPKRSRYTYNILTSTPLSEDRALFGDFQAKGLLMQQARVSSDEAFIENVIVADESYWEHGQEMPRGGSVSTAFMNVVARNQARVHPSVFTSYADHVPASGRTVLTPWERAERPWRVDTAEDGYQGRVMDKNGKVLFLQPLGEDGMEHATWNSLVHNMVACVNDHADRDMEAKLALSKRDDLPTPAERVGSVADVLLIAMDAPAEGIAAGQKRYSELLDDDIPF